MQIKSNASSTLRLDLRQAATVLLVASSAVFAAGVLRELTIYHIGTETLLQDLRHFALDAERSIPAWYSSLLMVVCATILFATACIARQEGRKDVRHWFVLTAFFLLMAIDEVVGFHEVLIEPLRNRLGLSGIFHFAWVIPGSAVVAVVGVYFLPFLLRLPRSTAVLFALSGAIYVGGALGLELIGGSLADEQGMQAAAYLTVAMLEEGLEIAGLTLFAAALARHLCAGREFSIRVGRRFAP